MKRISHLAAGVLILCAATSALAQTFPRNGFLGVYSDQPGTICCMTAPAGPATMYLWADLAGLTVDGVTGAEFRIFLPTPSGFFFSSYVPPVQGTDPTPATVVGNPLDQDVSPTNPAGLNIAFSACHTGVGGRVDFGSIPYFSPGAGSSTDVIVTRKTLPSNVDLFDCPLFTLCDAPAFSSVCMTVVTGTLPSGEEPVVFKATINKSCGGTSCGYVGVTLSNWSAVKGLYR